MLPHRSSIYDFPDIQINNDPSSCPSLEEFVISGRENNFKYNQFCLFSKNTTDKADFYMPIYNVLDDYMDMISKLATYVKLNDESYIKYRFRPKSLSYDLYDTINLYFILMKLNNCYNIKDFDFRYLYILDQDSMSTVLQSIYQSESPSIDIYNHDFLNQI